MDSMFTHLPKLIDCSITLSLSEARDDTAMPGMVAICQNMRGNAARRRLDVTAAAYCACLLEPPFRTPIRAYAQQNLPNLIRHYRSIFNDYFRAELGGTLELPEDVTPATRRAKAT